MGEAVGYGTALPMAMFPASESFGRAEGGSPQPDLPCRADWTLLGKLTQPGRMELE